MADSARAIQRRTLIRVPDLAAFRRVLAGAALDGDPAAIRRRALILPSRGAIELLRRTIEDAALSTRTSDGGAAPAADEPAIVLPLMLTREDWLSDLHAGLAGAPKLLARVEREVLLDRAARAAAAVAPPPFHLRPGLTGAIVDFYDELRRRGRTINRFAEVLADELSGAEDADDRGTIELVRQTEFLTRTFRGYEESLQGSGGIDEHQLRALSLSSSRWPVDHVVVAVADHPTDPRGLWPADFDLLGRLAGIAAIDIVVTDDAHDAGFRERIDREVPELDDVRLGGRPAAPTVLVPDDAASVDGRAARISVDYRDREEEVRAVARAIRTRAHDEMETPLSRTAIVFQRPLPYLYLAQQVLGEAGVPFQAFDTLPLSAEPYAALLDLALTVARTGGTRDSVLALLRSPLLHVEVEGQFVSLHDAAALDRVLIDGRITVAPEHYVEPVVEALRKSARPDARLADRATRAAHAVAMLAADLSQFRVATAGHVQVAAISTFLRTYERPAPVADRERHLRARSAVLSAVDRLADAYLQHDDSARNPDALSATIHHWVERQTFTPRQGTTGVHLVDAVAARFGSFDHVHLVGLVDAEWPERQRRSIFYTSELLKDLGWPKENDHLQAEQAAFRDLVRLPAKTLSLTAFQLEGEAVVAGTPLIDEARDLPRATIALPDLRIFSDELLPMAPIAADELNSTPAEWLTLRLERPDLSVDAYRGIVGAMPAQEYRVSALDRYSDCPFKYFASSVLRLDEEADEESALTPRERGTLLHSLFERFYREWSDAGWGAVTKDKLPEAIDRFERIANEALAVLPEADRIIETQRLLGSIVARGVAERVFNAEAADPRDVVARSLEFSLNGTYEFPDRPFAPPKSIAIRGIADRIDEFADGTLRVVDYKLTRAPQDHAVQLKVYAYAAQQKFAKNGVPRLVTAGEYISFGDDDDPVKSIKLKNSTVEQAVVVGAQEFAQHVTRIEAGEFPPEPDKTSLCGWCAFALLCRREAVLPKETDDAAESV